MVKATSDPQFVHCSHLAMEPSVAQASVNASIPICSGMFEIDADGKQTTCQGNLWFEPWPTTDLRFQLEFASKSVTPKIHSLVPSGADHAVKPLFSSTTYAERDDEVFECTTGRLNQRITFSTSNRIGRVRFHLLNFIGYDGEKIFHTAQNEFGSWPGRLVFDMGPWRVTIDSLPHASDRLRRARESRGYIITHVGNLERIPPPTGLPKLFGFAQAERALDALYYILSFANGSRCPCILPFGYRHDKGAECNWVSGYRASPAVSHGSWFDPSRPSVSFGFANKMYEILQKESERRWLTFAISLYLESNQNQKGTDIELAQSQITLELLSWKIVREEEQLMSKESFERLSSADKIRVALLWARIPPEIPSYMSKLNAKLDLLKNGESGPFDGPFAITQIRNATVQGTRSEQIRMDALGDIPRYQAWQLSQTYTSLLILRLLDYQAYYKPHYRGILSELRDEVALTKEKQGVLVPWVASRS